MTYQNKVDTILLPNNHTRKNKAFNFCKSWISEKWLKSSNLKWSHCSEMDLRQYNEWSFFCPKPQN